MVTDDTWKCSNRWHPGWFQPEFNDTAWPQAQVIGANDGSYAAEVTTISAQAKWIWVQSDDQWDAYCRKLLC